MGDLMIRTIDEIYLEYINDGTMPTGQEVVDLCTAASHGEETTAKYEAVTRALRRAGWLVLDATTDDSGDVTIEIKPPGTW